MPAVRPGAIARFAGDTLTTGAIGELATTVHCCAVPVTFWTVTVFGKFTGGIPVNTPKLTLTGSNVTGTVPAAARSSRPAPRSIGLSDSAPVLMLFTGR